MRVSAVGRRQGSLIAEQGIEHVGDVHQLVTKEAAERVRRDERCRP
ncbi:MAG: hypothetical protein HYZ58_13225 [Acidobacteria bacterium]|nr:hypothetical protein [Acidobacteriota bacterium]MBI3264094.1 hypothetical protein [Acidobacteriota bacterium]